MADKITDVTPDDLRGFSKLLLVGSGISAKQRELVSDYLFLAARKLELLSGDPEVEGVHLREIDPDTDNACWVVCAKGDPGAVLFVPHA